MGHNIEVGKHTATILRVQDERRLGLISYSSGISRSKIMEAIVKEFINNHDIDVIIKKTAQDIINQWNKLKKAGMQPDSVNYLARVKVNMDKKKLYNLYQECIMALIEKEIK